MNVEISVARDFSRTPGARHEKDGPFSGEKFRREFLEKHFVNPGDEYEITIRLDGTAGYATSFLEEAFGGLARKFGKDRCLRRFVFVCEDEPMLVDEIRGYIENA